MNADTLPILYQALQLDAETMILSHHGQLVIAAIERPDADTVTLRKIELPAPCPLQSLVDLAATIGIRSGAGQIERQAVRIIELEDMVQALLDQIAEMQVESDATSIHETLKAKTIKKKKKALQVQPDDWRIQPWTCPDCGEQMKGSGRGPHRMKHRREVAAKAQASGDVDDGEPEPEIPDIPQHHYDNPLRPPMDTTVRQYVGQPKTCERCGLTPCPNALECAKHARQRASVASVERARQLPPTSDFVWPKLPHGDRE